MREAPVYRRLPDPIVRGEGCRVFGASGRSYLDLYGGHAVAVLGYGHRGLTEAIARQAETLVFQSNAADNEARDRAVAALGRILPGELDTVLLLNSGAEAIENALRLAFRRTGRTKVAAVRGAFHGRTAAAAAITDGSSHWYGFPRSPFDVVWVEPEVETLESALTRDVAAFVFEPVQGVAGAVALDTGFLQTARQLCSERGISMIADEIQSGMGRTGHVLACERAGIVPDLATLAKALAGGLPAAAVVARNEWAEGLRIGDLGTTFGGGPVVAAAIEVVANILAEPGFLPGVRRRSELLRQAAMSAVVESTTGAGYLLGLRCRRPARDVLDALYERGILAGDARDPAVVRLLPPLVLGEVDIVEFAAAIREVAA